MKSDVTSKASNTMEYLHDVDLESAEWCELYGEDEFARFESDVRASATNGEIEHNVFWSETCDSRLETLFRCNTCEMVRVKTPIWFAEKSGFNECFLMARHVKHETEKAVLFARVETYNAHVSSTHWGKKQDELWVPKSLIEWSGVVLR